MEHETQQETVRHSAAVGCRAKARPSRCGGGCGAAGAAQRRFGSFGRAGRMGGDAMPERKLSDWICTDERIDRLSAFEEAFFYRLLTKADGKGRVDARPQVLKSAVYPLKKVTLKDVEKAARKLVHVGLASLYETEGREVLCVEDWGRYQRIRGTEVSKFKDPERDAACVRVAPRDAAGCGGTPPSSSPLPPSSPFLPPTPPNNPSSSPFPLFSSPCLPPGADAHREKTEQPRRQAGQGRRSGAQGSGKAAQRRSRHGLQGLQALQDVQDKDLQDMLHRLPASLRDKTEQWLRYKAERGEPYGKTGLDSLIEAILLAVRRHGESAVLKVMGDCMACGYKGIAFDRLERMRRRVVDTNTPSSSNLKEFSRWLFLQQYGGGAGTGTDTDTDTDADAGAPQGLHMGGLPM